MQVPVLQDKINGQNAFAAPMGQQLSAFLKASDGPFYREINQDEIDQKRRIIGVGAR